MFVFVTARVLEAALMQNFYASHLPKPFAFSSRLQIAHASKSVSFIHAWLHFPGLDGKKKISLESIVSMNRRRGWLFFGVRGWQFHSAIAQ